MLTTHFDFEQQTRIYKKFDEIFDTTEALNCDEDDDEPPELTEDDDDEENIAITVVKLDHRAKLPKYQSPGAAGIDLAPIHSVTLLPGESAVMDTGLVF